ncbi:MAG: hypothetical protein Q7R79_04255 [bacterium]|nr:hypothetical protein [bacterium]
MQTLAEKIEEKFPSLSPLVQHVIDMPEFSRQVDDIAQNSNLTERMQEFDEIIWSLLFKEIDAQGLLPRLQTLFSLSESDARILAKEIIGKILLLFPEYSGGYKSFYKELGGDLIEAYGGNIIFSSLPSHSQREILEHTGVATDIRNLVTEKLLDIVVSNDDKRKKTLNRVVLLLLGSNEDFSRFLASDMSANRQLLGNKTIERWLKDFIAIAGAGNVSTITIAAYLGENEYARQLNMEEKEILRNILEMYRVLSTYPEGFAKLPREEWMVIPYKKEERPITTRPNIKEQAPAILIDESGIPNQELGKNIQNTPIKKPIITQEPMLTSMSLSDYPALVEEVIQLSGLGDIDEETQRRLQNVVLTRIKNVRTAVETKEKLTTAKDKGGAGLTDEQAEKVLKAASMIAERVLKGEEKAVNSQQSAVSKPPQETEKKEEAPTEKEREEMVKKIDGGEAPFNLPTENSSKFTGVSSKQTEELTPPSEQKALPPAMPDVTPHSTKKELPALIPEKQKFSIEEIDGVPTFIEKKEVVAHEPRKIPVTVRSTPQQSAKPAMADVKGPRLVNPIEELRIMTLKDFRRLSSDPMEAVKRLHQKVQLLEKESFTKKQAAIDAWHESEVNKLYMEIGKESFGKGLDIQQVITNQQAQGKQTLSAQEFDALVELNEMMRF